MILSFLLSLHHVNTHSATAPERKGGMVRRLAVAGAKPKPFTTSGRNTENAMVGILLHMLMTRIYQIFQSVMASTTSLLESPLSIAKPRILSGGLLIE